MKITLRNILDALCNLFKPHPKNEAPVLKVPPIEEPKPIEPIKQNPVNETPWMDIVKKDEKDKVAEISGSANHPVIVAAHKAAGLHSSMWLDTTAWCASYMKYTFLRAGVSPDKMQSFNAWARNCLKFGEPSSFKYGCVMVFERNGPGGDSHVTFGLRQENDYYVCLGGNQSNSVKESKYHKDDLLGIRWPSEEMLKDMKAK